MQNLAIIIPTIGRPILHQTLDSLISQIQSSSQTRLYIGYDGNSSDQTFQELTQKYPQQFIHFLATESPYSGASNARNICLTKAIPNSDIIAFLGDDTVPTNSWISETMLWHSLNPDLNQALFGRIFWSSDLINDSLHKWLDGHIQFDFKRLDKGKIPDWHHFTTSNLSLKSKIFQHPTNLFNTTFKGWGFEDAELGYRLQTQKNLNINYNPKVKVTHHHPQTFPKVLQNLQNARTNALLFQRLHPEVKLIPKGIKNLILHLTTFPSLLIPRFISKKLYWWSRTKLVWMGYKFPIHKFNTK